MVARRTIWLKPRSINHSNTEGRKKACMKKHRHQAAARLGSLPASQFWKFYEWKMSGVPKPHEFSPWFW